MPFISIHALRVEGDLAAFLNKMLEELISIHALRVEGDVLCVHRQCGVCISIHALRVEGDYKTCHICIRIDQISIHALRVEGDGEKFALLYRFNYISIHALRVEGDAAEKLGFTNRINFYPRPPGGGRRQTSISCSAAGGFLSTPSGWRATMIAHPAAILPHNFYPRPPGGGRRLRTGDGEMLAKISIHALRVEGDVRVRKPAVAHIRISIHALRVEGDGARSMQIARETIFLSTPSGWRATGFPAKLVHPLRYFYPRPPGGGRRFKR